MAEDYLQGCSVPFSLSHFKKWMSEQTDRPKTQSQKELIGFFVESKINTKRLVGKIKSPDGDVVEIAREFRRSGGKILDMDLDNNLLIEVESGTFTLPKCFVRKIK